MCRVPIRVKYVNLKLLDINEVPECTYVAFEDSHIKKYGGRDKGTQNAPVEKDVVV